MIAKSGLEIEGEIVYFPQKLAIEQARNAENVVDSLRLDVERINAGEAHPGAHYANAALYAWQEARRLADKLHEMSNDLQSVIEVAIDYRQKAVRIGQEILAAKEAKDESADLARLAQERGDWLRSHKDYASTADMRAQEITELYNGDLSIALTSTRYFLNQVAPIA